MIVRNSKNLFHSKKRFSYGLMAEAASHGPNTIKNPQFVSFLQQSGFRGRTNPDRYEKKMRRRRTALYVMALGALAVFSWVMIESAHALSLF